MVVSGVRRSCDTDWSSTVRSRSVSSRARRRTRSSPSRARVSASATTPVNDSRNFSRSGPRLRSPGSATTKPNAVSMVVIGNAAGLPGSRSATRRPARCPAPFSSRSRATCSASVRLAGPRHELVRACDRQQADAAQAERVGQLHERAAQRHARLGVLDQLHRQRLQQRGVGRAAAGELPRLAQPRQHDAADDRDHEVDDERHDARRRLDHRRVVRLGEEEVERQPRRRSPRRPRRPGRRRSPRAAGAA